MRFPIGSKGYKELQKRADKVREENPHLSEAELDAKLREVRDEYVREFRLQCNMPVWPK
jgi:histidinol dehydrogenase